MTHAAIAFAAVPVAAILAGGCQKAPEAANNVVVAAPVPKAAPTPQELAQRLVRQRAGDAGELTFADAQVFGSEGAMIVCGRFAQAGQPQQRYVAVGEEDVFIESQMRPGHMDQAVNEFCRNV
jgi:hypothetical protein